MHPKSNLRLKVSAVDERRRDCLSPVLSYGPYITGGRCEFPCFSCSLSVGEEIEMTPMVFAKGLADSGCWGDKLFGRLVSEELRGGGHGLQKASRAKVIYGLEPIFESGRTCIIKVSSLLVFGPSSETSLLGRNYDVTIQVLSRPFSVLYSLFPFPIWLFLEAPCGDGSHLHFKFVKFLGWASRTG